MHCLLNVALKVIFSLQMQPYTKQMAPFRKVRWSYVIGIKSSLSFGCHASSLFLSQMQPCRCIIIQIMLLSFIYDLNVPLFLTSTSRSSWSLCHLKEMPLNIEPTSQSNIHHMLLQSQCSSHYAGNTCSKLGDQAPSYMSPVPIGGLLQIMDPQALPPTLAPMPSLHAADVVEPPLPAVSPKPSSFGAGEESGLPPSQPSYGRHLVASIFLSLVMLCGSLLV